MKYYCIVACAGIGKRMNLGYPKQFLEYDGKPIFVNVLETMEKTPEVTDIIVVTGGEYIDEVKKICEKFEIRKLLNVVAGGAERQDSIYNALAEIKDMDAVVAVQDGVRPFIKERYLSECYNIIAEGRADGVAVGVPAKDTIKIIDESGAIVTTPPRKNVVAIHTPQVFMTGTLKSAYEKAKAEGFCGTDDAMLVERLGKKVNVYFGDYDNIKITTPEDLIYLDNNKK